MGAIRTGKIKVLNYLISQNIICINLFDDESKYESDLKSLIFNILRAIEIGTKKNSTNCFLCAQQFWSYLAIKLYQKTTNDDGGDNKALKKLINARNNEEPENEIVRSLRAMNENISVIKNVSLFMNTMFSKQTKFQNGTYNHRLGKDKLMKIFAVLQFQRERYITFQRRENIKNSWRFLCNSLIAN